MPESLQKKLLRDPCFLNAYTLRIQVYMQWSGHAIYSVPLDFHQDGIPPNIVERGMYSRSVVVSETAASTSSTGLDDKKNNE